MLQPHELAEARASAALCLSRMRDAIAESRVARDSYAGNPRRAYALFRDALREFENARSDFEDANDLIRQLISGGVSYSPSRSTRPRR